MRRIGAAGFIGVIVLATMLVAPGAEAAEAGGQSTACALVATMKFKPAWCTA